LRCLTNNLESKAEFDRASLVCLHTMRVMPG
jgi:hypothetical protein